MTSPPHTLPVPLCPCTGEQAVRLVQTVPARLLVELWRRVLGADVRSSFGDVRRFGLWESPTGLYFFDPPVEGDAVFYQSFYRNRTLRRHLEDPDRSEFRQAATHVGSGDRVLDVGCGFGPFRHHVPQARYLGLDPHFAGANGEEWARRESLADHLRTHAAHYDVATAFQVMEHLADPLSFLTDLGRAVRPGGKVLVGVPHVGGAHTMIPNYLINAVPHHLTWWTRDALAEAATRSGLRPVAFSLADWSRSDVIVYWMSRLSPIRCRSVHYRHSWAWHASTVWAGLAAQVAARLMPLPRPGQDSGLSMLMVAERV